MKNFESNWIWIAFHDGKCPIPWAKAGEYEILFRDRTSLISKTTLAKDFYWGNNNGSRTIVAWRLTNRWLPVIGGECPEASGFCAGEWEYKLSDGSIEPGTVLIIEGGNFRRAVAVRLIKSAEKTVLQVCARDVCWLGIQEISQEVINSKVQDTLDLYVKGFNPANYTDGRDDAYRRFCSSPRGKEALAQIGKAVGPQFRPLGEDAINNIAAAALHEHDKIWPRKI